jgi:hypothetical protein
LPLEALARLGRHLEVTELESSKIGRISSSPPTPGEHGARFAHSIASSSDLHCQIQ